MNDKRQIVTQLAAAALISKSCHYNNNMDRLCELADTIIEATEPEPVSEVDTLKDSIEVLKLKQELEVLKLKYNVGTT